MRISDWSSDVCSSDLDDLEEPAPALGTLPRGEPVQVFAVPPGTPARPRIARAEGIYMWETAGRRYIDAGSGPVSCNLGYGTQRALGARQEPAEAAPFAHPSASDTQATRGFAGPLAEAAGPRH